MRLGKICIALLTMTALLQACSPFDRLGEDGKLLLGSDEALFRNIDMDVNPTVVKQTETASLTEESEFYLGYEQLPGADGQHIELEYSFNNDNKLDFIAAYYKMPDEQSVTELTAALEKYFDKKYGDSKEDELGWHIWTFADAKGEPGNIEIVLNSDIDNAEQEYGVDLEIVKYYEYE